MSYKVVIRKQAKKKLLALPKNLRYRIAEKIQWLGIEPDDRKLDTKKLSGSPYYRLRVGDLRIIYERDDQPSNQEEMHINESTNDQSN